MTNGKENQSRQWEQISGNGLMDRLKGVVKRMHRERRALFAAVERAIMGGGDEEGLILVDGHAFEYRAALHYDFSRPEVAPILENLAVRTRPLRTTWLCEAIVVPYNRIEKFEFHSRTVGRIGFQNDGLQRTIEIELRPEILQLVSRASGFRADQARPAL